MTIRLQHGGAYISDINALRDRIRANGTAANIVGIPVSHPGTNHTFTIYVNLAYQANGNVAPANASIYTVGFANAAGAAWHFNIAGLAGLPGAMIPGNLAGSYASLGHAFAPLPGITNLNLQADVSALATYAGGAVNQALMDSLIRMIVVVSEAARFGDVASGVNGVLGNGNPPYVAPLATLQAWGGHTLGNN